MDDVTVGELLARHGIASPTEHSPGEGGRIAGVLVVKDGAGAILTATIGNVSASGTCPIEEADALQLVRSFRGRGLPAADPALERMFAHLLLKISALFFDCAAEVVEFDSVHLHQSAYQIGKVRISGAPPLHVKARLAHDTHDRHAIFDHRHGDSITFPK
jgi:hypothetical protein